MKARHKKRLQAAAAGTLTLSLVLGSALPAWAAEGVSGSVSVSATPAPMYESREVTEEDVQISREEAEARMKELFPILRRAKLNQVSLGSSSFPPASEAIWSLHWTVTRDDGRGSYGFSSEIDAMTGDVLSMHFPEHLLDEPSFYPPKISREEALNYATSIIQQAIPSLKDTELKEDENSYAYGEGSLFGPFMYSFSFVTQHQGIPIPFQFVHVGIDGNGNLIHLSYRPIPGSIPVAAEPMAKEKALALYEEQLDLELSYVNVNRYGEKPNWVLAWVPSSSYTSILDAATGEWLDSSGTPIPEGSSNIQFETIAPSPGISFQAEKTDKATISQQRAAAIIGSVFPVPNDYELTYQSLDQDPYIGTQVWQLSWRQNHALPFGFPQGIWAMVDAVTGQIYEVRKDSLPPYATQSETDQAEGESREPISEEEAKRMADDLVAKLFPDATQSLKRVTGILPNRPAPPSSDKHQFMYQLFHNEYPVQHFMVHVQLDEYGELESYSARNPMPPSAPAELPKQPAVGKTEAKRLWLERSDLSLQYDRFGGYYINDGERVEESLLLTYRHTWKEGADSAILDAVSGEWVSSALSSISMNSKVRIPEDIAGHEAEEDLKTLAAFRALDTDEEGNANPDDPITREQWAHWLAAAVQPYYLNSIYSHSGEAEEQPLYQDVSIDDDLHKALQVLFQRNWLQAVSSTTSFGPSDTLTREELAVWAAHVLNYDRLAEHLNEDPQITAVKDYEQIAHPGAAALAVKLNLLQIQDNAWEPDKAVTRAEAASFLMHLVRLQSSVDQQVNRSYY